MAVNAWMSWEGGVDLVAKTNSSLEQPNVIVHVARMVNTPVGSAPSGMILIPDASGAPQLMGFVSSDLNVGKYFGPHIFAGTPFESAPVLEAQFTFKFLAPQFVSVRLEAGGHVIESKLSGLMDLELAERDASTLPFSERALEAPASRIELTFDGAPMSIIRPSSGMSGGPAAAWSPTGMYWR
jgi:hypothetical protein